MASGSHGTRVLGRVESGSQPECLPKAGSNSTGTGIVTDQFPFPDLMVPEDFS